MHSYGSYKIAVKPAGVNEIPQIRAMAEVVFRRTYADILSPEQMEYMMEWMYSENSLAVQVSAPGKYFFIAYVDDVPAGYVSFEYEEIMEDGRRLYHLQKLYVMPEFQGYGLGRHLLQFVRGMLSSMNPGGCRVELNVNRNNSAVGFYAHCGLSRVRQGDFPIGNGYYMNDYIYALDI